MRKTVNALPICLVICILHQREEKKKSPEAGLPLSHEDGGYEVSGLTSNTPCSSQHRWVSRGSSQPVTDSICSRTKNIDREMQGSSKPISIPPEAQSEQKRHRISWKQSYYLTPGFPDGAC